MHHINQGQGGAGHIYQCGARCVSVEQGWTYISCGRGSYAGHIYIYISVAGGVHWVFVEGWAYISCMWEAGHISVVGGIHMLGINICIR